MIINGPNNITDVCFLKPNICPNGKCVPDNSVSQVFDSIPKKMKTNSKLQ